MNNFLKKYWLKITDKTKHEETKILKRIEKEKKIFQSKFSKEIQRKSFQKLGNPFGFSNSTKKCKGNVL